VREDAKNIDSFRRFSLPDEYPRGKHFVHVFSCLGVVPTVGAVDFFDVVSSCHVPPDHDHQQSGDDALIDYEREGLA